MITHLNESSIEEAQVVVTILFCATLVNQLGFKSQQILNLTLG